MTARLALSGSLTRCNLCLPCGRVAEREPLPLVGVERFLRDRERESQAELIREHPRKRFPLSVTVATNRHLLREPRLAPRDGLYMATRLPVAFSLASLR